RLCRRSHRYHVFHGPGWRAFRIFSNRPAACRYSPGNRTAFV
ncbi:uncharacterized protein METZ01_LOCUS359803, partial [marine metagenome]